MINNFYFLIILFLTLFIPSLPKNIKKDKKEPIKPTSYSYIPLDIDFRTVGNMQKISKKNLKKVNQYLSSIKILLKSLIYVNFPKKKLTLNKTVLENFDISYSNDEPLSHNSETIKKHLVILINYKQLRTRLFSTRIYKAEKTSMRNPDKKHCYLGLITINTSLYRDFLNYSIFFRMTMIKEIFYLLCFRKPYFQKNGIRNNFDKVPYYLIKDLKSFKSYKKYLTMTDREYKPVSYTENGKFYLYDWPDSYKINDIMSLSLKHDTPVTELTANIFNDLKKFSFNNCDLLKYKAGFGRGFSCIRPDQKCIDEETFNKKYFLEYTINKQSWKCYLNTKENIKNKQCGVLYGNLCNLKLEYRYCPTYKKIRQNLDRNQFPIPELENYNSQHLKLLKKGKFCPAYFPRSIFFTVPESVFDQYKEDTISNTTKIMEEINSINKDVEYDEIVIDEKDRKYYVTYESTEEYYSRECVMKVMNNSGVIRSYSSLNSHNLLLKQPFPVINYKKIPRFQKIYSFINFSILSHKDLTYKYYLEMKNNFPDEYNYIADSYLYPEEKHKIEKMLKNYKVSPDDLWLIKPKSGSLGHGIRIFLSLNDIPEQFLLTRYISPPHLINNKKYDFRVYILVTGLAPFRLYIYTEGLVRFASEEYSTNIKDLTQSYRHLTNISLNKKNIKSFILANDVDTEEGNRWSFQAYEEYCKKNNINYGHIFEQMKDNSIKAFISVHKEYYEKIISKNKQCHNFFELHGLDYLPDQNFKLYFLEGNDRPSLIMGDINDSKLKPQLVADILNIVGIVPYSHEYDDDFKPYEDKENKFPYYNNEEERVKHDVEDALCELGRPRGKFKLIFPLKENIEKYRKLFKIKLPENELLWKHILEEEE